MSTRRVLSVEHIYYCDGPTRTDLGEDESQMERCPVHQRTTRDHAPPSWITVVARGVEDGGDTDVERNFCSWDCVLRFSGQLPPEEIIVSVEGPM